ncbi:hypothetical protein AK812_SmicGene22729 [Symbiodinium microadriaticum]|uniref:Uncharacterized protein n=1 Tax=Symbiodinium microadriaticum TaxID=2951 RepID=A0A1Q9DJ19_SYMMI|nr:hypothetical protein AK812_SmicGene22729 [Symbiodinium microadriaticum]
MHFLPLAKLGVAFNRTNVYTLYSQRGGPLVWSIPVDAVEAQDGTAKNGHAVTVDFVLLRLSASAVQHPEKGKLGNYGIIIPAEFGWELLRPEATFDFDRTQRKALFSDLTTRYLQDVNFTDNDTRCGYLGGTITFDVDPSVDLSILQLSGL